MSVIKANGAGAAGADFYTYKIGQSLRFHDGDSAYLTRDPSSAGNRQKFTYSVWFKRSVLSGTEMDLFSAGDSATDRFEFILSSAYPNQLQIYMNTSGTIGSIITSQVFRDVSAWYHLVVAFDTTQGTAANRVKIYVNGSQITNFHTETYPSQNFNTAVNSTSNQYISKRNYANDRYYDGYMAEINMIDGQQLTPASFGETKDGIWVAKDSSGLTFGTNGFYLPFDDSSAIGDDESDNTNDFTVANLAATDVVKDSPTNNFCTLNSIDRYIGTNYLKEGALLMDATGVNAWRGNARSTFQVDSGKWYWEVCGVGSGGFFRFGIRPAHVTLSIGAGDAGNGHEYYPYIKNSITVGGNASYGSDDDESLSDASGIVWAVALDMDNGTLTIYRNNTSLGQMSSSLTGQQSPTISSYNGSTGFNFGQDSSFAGAKTAQGNADGNGIGDFFYAPPSGYLALCTANLPDLTVGPTASTLATDNFNTVLYTGNNSTQSITGVGFEPDWVWLKSRSSTYDHTVYDVIRGATYKLPTNDTYQAAADADTLTSFDDDGFSLGDDVKVNANAEALVSWNWKAKTAFSGTTNRSKDYSGRSNSAAGFSIITYVGDEQVGHEIPHNLDAAPEFVIARSRGHADHWDIYHAGIASDAETDFIRLNSGNAAADAASVWNDTKPSSTVVTLGNTDDLNKNNIAHIMYAFHSVEGYSRVDSYAGNGNVDGTFVFTGFRPAFLLIKSSSSGSTNWLLFDNKRDVENPVELELNANNANPEYNNGRDIDFVSNGFKIRTSSNTNVSSGTLIYYAVAEQPFKFANAR